MDQPGTNTIVEERAVIKDIGNTNMKVIIRVRPESDLERRSSYKNIVTVVDAQVKKYDTHLARILHVI